MDQWGVVFNSLAAGLLASLACGLGALPVAFKPKTLEPHIGLGYAFAGGLMFAASVYNLLMPAFTIGGEAATELRPVLLTVAGLLTGAAVL